jgi:hypothetical protein
VFLLAIGGVLTYIAYWPDQALAQAHGTHHHGHKNHPEQNITGIGVKPTTSPSPQVLQNEEILEEQILAFEIIGPMLIGFGLFLGAILGALALKYDCDHEPEPNIAFLRLKSELSLISFDPEKYGAGKYELMVPMVSRSASASANTTSKISDSAVAGTSDSVGRY